jgi:hypothetical protein
MLVMGSPTAADEPHVLVVYVSFAVGGQLATLLMESATVSLARVSGACRMLSGTEPCHVVVLCPYLDETERRALIDACSGHTPQPAVIEVNDEAGGPSVRVLTLPDDEHMSHDEAASAVFASAIGDAVAARV